MCVFDAVSNYQYMISTEEVFFTRENCEGSKMSTMINL